jgi:Holliday junction DNA helicase RuvA
MIAYLKGDFVYKSPAVVHIDVNGVGYEVQISLHTFSKIQALGKGSLHTSLLIREDAHIIYGFFDLAEKEMFLHLLSVSGIGASTARVILSYMKPDELARAIILGDGRTLEGIKGIGKKTAERMILELKDKLKKDGPVKSIVSHLRVKDEAMSALLTLGFSRNAVDKTVDLLLREQPAMTVEDLIRKALKTM